MDSLVATLHNALDSETPLEPRLQSALQEVSFPQQRVRRCDVSNLGVVVVDALCVCARSQLYNALCSVRSHVEPEDTQLFPVEETSRRPDTTATDSMARDTSRLYEAVHAKMQDESLYMHGWKFPTVFVSPMDEKHLMEMQTRLLTAPDQAQTLAVLLELSGAAMLDYPAAVFLQQQGFLLTLLQLLTLPDTNVVIGASSTFGSRFRIPFSPLHLLSWSVVLLCALGDRQAQTGPKTRPRRR